VVNLYPISIFQNFKYLERNSILNLKSHFVIYDRKIIDRIKYSLI
jgi:hypothetical protein